jgi:site-specific DNA recombinase
MEHFDKHRVSFVAVTQQLNTTTSIGRLTLNILLSFAQFEREIIGERTRDKMRAARRKGKWIGGMPVLGYDVAAQGGRLVVNQAEAKQVRQVFELYTRHRSVAAVVEELDRRGWTTKRFQSKRGKQHGGRPFREPTVLRLLTNPLYAGRVGHGGELYAGEHDAIVAHQTWEAIQEKLRSRKGRPRVRVAKPEKALLNGLLFCHICERPMTHNYAAAHGREYRYYVCRRFHGEQRLRCPAKAVSAPVIEDSVVQQLQERLGRKSALGKHPEMEGWVRRLVERVSYDGTTGGVKLRLATIDPE